MGGNFTYEIKIPFSITRSSLMSHFLRPLGLKSHVQIGSDLEVGGVAGGRSITDDVFVIDGP